MKDEPHRQRHHGEAAPTVIHHYGEDETLLWRWLQRAAEQGTRFWLMVVGAAIMLVALIVIISGLMAGDTTGHEAWTLMIQAKGPEDLQRLAESQPDSKAAPWALLQAAEARYREGFEDLPGKHEAAEPLLNRAYELFNQAYQDADAKDPVKRYAALGMARALEARKELDRAIKQYDLVAKEWPDTPEGKQAAQLAARLRKPESIEFYNKLYAFKRDQVTLPPGGSFPLGLPPNHPALNGPTIPAGPIPDLPIPPLPPAGSTGATPKAGGGEFPSNVFENNPPPAPKAETPTEKSLAPERKE